MKQVRVDETEYEALCTLRDVTHAQLLALHGALQTRMSTLNEDNHAKTHFISKQELEIRFLREDNQKQHGLILQMQKRLAELEPVKCETEQPLFARKK